VGGSKRKHRFREDVLWVDEAEDGGVFRGDAHTRAANVVGAGSEASSVDGIELVICVARKSGDKDGLAVPRKQRG
jgi:hypothetical protein